MNSSPCGFLLRSEPNASGGIAMATSLDEIYGFLHEEAVRLAGGLNDAEQRAATYRHLYRFSGGNHVFPLIAAHGALWSRNYFRAARRLATALSWQYAHM